MEIDRGYREALELQEIPNGAVFELINPDNTFGPSVYMKIRTSYMDNVVDLDNGQVMKFSADRKVKWYPKAKITTEPREGR